MGEVISINPPLEFDSLGESRKCPEGDWLCMVCDVNHASVRITPLNYTGPPTKPEQLDLCPSCMVQVVNGG